MNSTKLRGAPGFASRRKENDTRAEDSIPRVGRDATAWQRLKPAGTARILPLLLLLILPVLAQAQFNYEISNGTLTITGYTGAGGDVVIPGTIDGLPVTRIGEWAFYYCTSLTSVTIPDSVTSIGSSAFSGCTGLTGITIPDSVTSIGFIAFYNCTGLTDITVDVLNPFYSSVDGVLFDKSQTTLIQCPARRAGSYTIPNSVLWIGYLAFADCIGLTGVMIPNSVTGIGESAFDGCIGLTSVMIGNGVTSIGWGAFSYCTGLTSLTIGNGVTSIDRDAFRGCTGLTSVTIGNGVTSIGSYAFYDCSSLTEVYFQGNAPSLGLVVFNGSYPTVRYLPGTTGWGPTFDDRPTALWALPAPVILTAGSGLGVQDKGFGFTISWATNLTVVVEARTDMSSPTWSPVGTNTLVSGSAYFSDPQWTNDPVRFYRLRSP